MKNLLIVLIIILASGCRSTKKITESSNVTDKKTDIVQTVITSDSKKIANDKKIETTTITTKTEYYPPDAPDTINPVSGIKSDKPKEKGAIKSTETTVTTTRESDKGVTEDNSNQNAATNIGQNVNTKTEEKVTDKKTIPIPWGWIFGILVIIAGAIIYLKRSKVFPWLKSVLSSGLKIPKI